MQNHFNPMIYDCKLICGHKKRTLVVSVPHHVQFVFDYLERAIRKSFSEKWEFHSAVPRQEAKR